jgi:membrane fusion protein (multidrug efflux system)
VIPASAVGNDQQGDFVYVVTAGDVVERRSIVKGPVTEAGLAIRSGLSESDRVIVNGLLNARVGEKVAPTVETAPAPPAATKPAPPVTEAKPATPVRKP